MRRNQHAGALKVLVIPLSLAVVIHLAACKSSDKPPAHMSMESVEALEAELAADPKRLKEMQRRCKYEREVVGEQVCAAVSGATRKRFMGSGQAKYTPEPVDVLNSPDADSP